MSGQELTTLLKAVRETKAATIASQDKGAGMTMTVITRMPFDEDDEPTDRSDNH